MPSFFPSNLDFREKSQYHEAMALQESIVRRPFIRSFEAKELKRRPLAIRFADDLTAFFGSIPFLILNLVVFVLWALVNTGLIPFIEPFDPFPFPMLTTVVSLEAIILTLIVLMSQNRSSLISSMREEIDIQVNLIAEKEITKILKLLDLLLKDRGIKVTDKELEEMLKEINESYIERRLKAQLSTKSKPLLDKIAEPIRKATEELEEEVEKIEKEVKNTISSK